MFEIIAFKKLKVDQFYIFIREKIVMKLTKD